MRILFIGDIVGRPGINFVRAAVPLLRASDRLHPAVPNAETPPGGPGLTQSMYRQPRDAAVDAVTLGDHIYKRAEIIPLLKDDLRVCKPANFPPEAPGREFVI